MLSLSAFRWRCISKEGERLQTTDDRRLAASFRHEKDGRVTWDDHTVPARRCDPQVLWQFLVALANGLAMLPRQAQRHPRPALLGLSEHRKFVRPHAHGRPPTLAWLCFVSVATKMGAGDSFEAPALCMATSMGAGDSEEAPFLCFFPFLRGSRPLGLGPARVPELIRLARPLTHLCPSVGAPWVPASHVCLSSSDLPPHSPPRPVGPRSVSLGAAHVPFAHPHRPPPAAAALASLPP